MGETDNSVRICYPTDFVQIDSFHLKSLSSGDYIFARDGFFIGMDTLGHYRFFKQLFLLHHASDFLNSLSRIDRTSILGDRYLEVSSIKNKPDTLLVTKKQLTALTTVFKIKAELKKRGVVFDDYGNAIQKDTPSKFGIITGNSVTLPHINKKNN